MAKTKAVVSTFDSPPVPFDGNPPPGAPVDFAHPRDPTAPGFDPDAIPEETPANQYPAES
jgi:hypothetical protein